MIYNFERIVNQKNNVHKNIEFTQILFIILHNSKKTKQITVTKTVIN